MRFLVCIDDFFREELDGIANGFMTNNHQVVGFDRSIYRAFDESNPDCVVFSPATYGNPEIRRFIEERKINHFVVETEKLSFSNGFVLNLPSFANTIKYKPELPSKELESDISIVFDGKNGEFVHDIYHRFHKEYKIKVIGGFINCPGYIGLGTQQDVVKLAKSSRLTITTNKIVANSLLYNNILAVYNRPNPIELLNLNKSEIDKLVLAEKKQIITENKLGKIILEQFSNFS